MDEVARASSRNRRGSSARSRGPRVADVIVVVAGLRYPMADRWSTTQLEQCTWI